MRVTQNTLLLLFQDVHMVHLSCLFYRARCLAHRMLNFGFEPFINTYEPRELLVIAALLPQIAHDALVREAYERGDANVRAWIDTHVPESLHV